MDDFQWNESVFKCKGLSIVFKNPYGRQFRNFVIMFARQNFIYDIPYIVLILWASGYCSRPMGRAVGRVGGRVDQSH